MNYLLFAFAFQLMSVSSPTDPPESFAVVELFTSQGCSSCPPADVVLRKLVEEYAARETPVYALSFHVDYWNYIGWKDPYSDARFSERQRAYAGRLQSRVYTPQMVVNGKTEFVGSREGEARQSVRSALKRSSKATVNAEATLKEDQVHVEFSTSAARGVVNIALVERNISTQVKRGENRNRTLRHDNVVRAFRQVKIGNETSVELLIPDDVDRSQSEVIVYVQTSSVGEIIAASRAKF